MFPTSLQRPSTKDTEHQDPEAQHRYTITDHGYGKNSVKMLHVKREGQVHTIKEFEIDTHLKLSTTKDYVQADNSVIIDSDSLKNIAFLLAKIHGIENPEEFAMTAAAYILKKYSHVEEVHIHVEESLWNRIYHNKVGQSTQEHTHAFKYSPTAVHYCDVVMRRTDPKQTVVSGVKGLRVLKTTQSSFVNFIKDELSLTPDLHDRTFCAIADCSWEYSHTNNVKFYQDWNTVNDVITDKFAGDAIKGSHSFSLQNNVHLTAEKILDVLPHISRVSITMLNKHYINFDTKPFQGMAPGENNEVFVSLDNPHSVVYAQLARKDI